MARIKIIKAWGNYKPGDIIKHPSAPTYRELVTRLKVAVPLPTKEEEELTEIISEELEIEEKRKEKEELDEIEKSIEDIEILEARKPEDIGLIIDEEKPKKKVRKRRGSKKKSSESRTSKKK